VAGALLLAIALAACTFPPSTAGQPKASPTPESVASLAAAQAAVYANKYTEAERLFEELLAANPKSVDGHAYFALFLNYNHRFAEALAQVQAAVDLDKNSALAQAINTRVHDWMAGSDHAALKAAADIGAKAVKLGPRSALTHAFYSEALADSGDTAAAKPELDAATPLAQGDYEKAEVEREKANLALDGGDKPAQLGHLKASRDAQPGWAERTKELAAFYFDNGARDQGIALLKQAIDSAPGDPSLRLFLGSVALNPEHPEIPLASEALSAANKLKPHDAAIESVLAMSDFTLNHDVGEAESLLRQANADDPTDRLIADMLYGFLRYIKNDKAAADQVRVALLPGAPTNPLGSSLPVSVNVNRNLTAQAALKTLNDYRAKAKLPPVRLDSRISAGAESHSYFWLFNFSNPALKDLGIHRESPGTPGYTGATMRERAVHFGFPNYFSMAEVIDHTGNPQSAVTVWIDSVFHRFPLMSPLLDAVGFGEGIGGSWPIETMDMSFKTESGDPASFVPFPADGQTGVPLAFTGNELPDPVPGGYTSPTGYPITVNFNPNVSPSVRSASITEAGGAPVDSWTLQPTKSEQNVLTILPKSPLKPNAKYSVHVSGTTGGTNFTRDWSFTTEGGSQGQAA
jgi:predicted Zn-dependent protease